MTIIAYRDGVIAADSYAYDHDSLAGSVVKICRNANGDLAGASGNSVMCSQFLTWFKNGGEATGPMPLLKDPDDKEIFARVMVVRKDTRSIWVYEYSANPFPITADYYALGSGRAEAKGAMFAGADAVEAVKAAIHFDPHCGGEIAVLRFDDV